MPLPTLIITILAIGVTVAAGIAAWYRRKWVMATRETDRVREQALTQMLSPAYLSHEIRTPLTIINGACELLDDPATGELNEHQQQFVRTMRNNSTQAVRLAEEFLTLYSLEKAIFALSISRANIREIVRESVQEYRLMHDADIRLDNHGAPHFVNVDEKLLKQALWNLFTNALRYGGPNVTVLVTVSAQDGIALIQVEDNGPGMLLTLPESAAGALTNDTTTSPSRSDTLERGTLPRAGSGIGMDIVKRILAAHAGTMLVDSTPGKGTRILLQLPLRPE